MSKRTWVLSLSLLLPSCGGGGASAPTTPASTNPCSQTLLFQGSAVISAGFAAPQGFSVTSSVDTRLDVAVDWASTASAIGVYVVQGACTQDQFLARTCTFVVQSEPSTAKPRLISATVAVGAYTLVVANLGTLDESVVAQLVLSNATCAPLAREPAGAVALPSRPLKGFLR